MNETFIVFSTSKCIRVGLDYKVMVEEARRIGNDFTVQVITIVLVIGTTGQWLPKG